MSITNNYNFISLLPLEISSEIFKYLTVNELANVSLVCKDWHKRCSQEMLWKNIALSLSLPKLLNNDFKNQVIVFFTNKKNSTVTTEKELHTRIDDFFKKAKHESKIITLEYLSTAKPKAYLRVFMILGGTDQRVYHEKGKKELSEQSDARLFIIGKNQADFGSNDSVIGTTASVEVKNGIFGETKTYFIRAESLNIQKKFFDKIKTILKLPKSLNIH